MALIKCPECGKEVSDQSDVCVNCGYPIKNQNVKTLVELVGDNYTKVEAVDETKKVTTSTNKVEAYDVMILEYSGLKLLAKNSLAEICNISKSEANDILSDLPCYIYDDIEKKDAEEIANRLMKEGFRVAVYDPIGNVRYFEPNSYSNKPLPVLVPVPTRRRYILPSPVIMPRPRAIKMPKVSPGIGIGLRSVPGARINSRPGRSSSLFGSPSRGMGGPRRGR